MNKLYMVGEWDLSFNLDKAAAGYEANDPWTIIDESAELDVEGELKLTTTKVRTVTC